MEQIPHPAFAPPADTKAKTIEPGDALRARVHYLVAQHHAMVVQTQFADAKAAALMALSGIAALRVPMPETIGSLEIALLASLLATVVLCLWAIIPRYARGASDARDRFTWLSLTSAHHDPAAIFAFGREGPFPELLDALTASNHGGAMVLRKKFRYIRWAVYLALFAIVLVVTIALRQSDLLPSVG